MSYAPTDCNGNPGGSCWLYTSEVQPILCTESCYNSGNAPRFTPFLFDVPVMKALCESMPSCSSFSTSDGFLRSFKQNSSLTAWVKWVL